MHERDIRIATNSKGILAEERGICYPPESIIGNTIKWATGSSLFGQAGEGISAMLGGAEALVTAAAWAQCFNKN